MDDRQMANDDFGRGDRNWQGSGDYQEEWDRLMRAREARNAHFDPPRPSEPSGPLTPGGAAATVAILVVGYFALAIISGNGSAVAVQMFQLGSWLIFIAAAFLVPLIALSTLTQRWSGLQGDSARPLRWQAFLVLCIGLGLGRIAGGSTGMMLATLVAAAILYYLLGKSMSAKAAAGLAIAMSVAVFLICRVGEALLLSLTKATFFA